MNTITRPVQTIITVSKEGNQKGLRHFDRVVRTSLFMRQTGSNAVKLLNAQMKQKNRSRWEKMCGLKKQAWGMGKSQGTAGMSEAIAMLHIQLKKLAQGVKGRITV